MKYSKTYLILFFAFTCNWIYAQENLFKSFDVPTPTTAAFLKHVDVPVEISRGVANISVPIHNLGQGDINIPISLDYNSSGIKVNEAAGWVGMNWNLNVGGIIHRTVRGVADEYSNGYFYTRQNWTFNGTEPTEYTVVQIGAGQYDGEPDLFSFSFPGYSGKFYIDKDKNPVLVPRQDLKIEFFWNPTNDMPERLSKFIITDPKGVKYHFGEDYQSGLFIVDYLENICCVGGTPGNNEEVPVGWHLTKIESQTHQNDYSISYRKQVFEFKIPFSGNGKMEIDDIPVGNANSVAILNSSPSFYSHLSTYKTTTYVPNKIYCSQTNEEVYFHSIGTEREDIGQFSYDKGRTLDYLEIRNSRGIACRRVSFNYDYYTTEDYNPNTSEYFDKRLRLEGIQESFCDGSTNGIPPYSFEYASDYFPSTTSRAIDHWGYYNSQVGNEPNDPSNFHMNIPPTTLIKYDGTSYTKGESNRDTDESSMLQGVLSKINFPTGGYHKFDFEANRYYDSEDEMIVLCGGLRLKKLEISSDDAAGPPIIKNYTYSSGKLINKPVYGHQFIKTNAELACGGGGGLANCNIQLEFLVWNEQSTSPLISFNGYHITYGNVVEHYGNQASINSDLWGYSNPQPNFGKYPKIPITFSPYTGKLTENILLNSEGETVSQNEFTYEASQTVVESNDGSFELFVLATGIEVTFNGGGNGDCCNFLTHAYFPYSTYYPYSGYCLKEEIKNTTDGIIKKEIFEYRGDKKHYLPIKHTIIEGVSASAQKITDIKYAEEAQQTDFIASVMKERHLIGIPLESRIMGGDGGGSKLEYDLLGNHFKPVKYYQATSGSNYEMGTGDSQDWKLMADASYSGNSDFPTTVKFRDNILTTEYNWSGFGYGLLSTVSLGTRINSYTYNSQRQLESITDSDGISNEFTIDKIGRLKQSILDSGRETNDITYSYQGENKITTVKTFEDGIPSLTFEDVYDGLGRPFQNRKLSYLQSGQDYISSIYYNDVGLIARECEPNSGGCTVFHYEKSPLERVSRIWPAGSYKPILKDYGNDGFFYKVTTTDENGNTSSDAIDVLGRTRKMYDGFNEVTSYIYNSRNQPVQVNPPGGGMPYIYTYYDDGLLKTRTVPDKGTYSYEYNYEDQIAIDVLPNSTTLNYDYHETYNTFLKGIKKDNSILMVVNTPVDISLSDRVFQQNNRIVSPSGVGGWVSNQYSYYPIGLLESSSTQGIDGSVETSIFVYDSNNNLTEETTNITGPDGITLPSIQKEYFYPKGVRLRKTELSYNGETQVLNDLNYNDRDYLISREIGNGLQKIDYTYTPRGWLRQINSVQGTFAPGEGCPPKPPVICEPDKQESRMIQVEYNASKISNQSPTAINFEISLFESTGTEQLLVGSQSFVFPINGYAETKEFDITNTKSIYLPEENDSTQVLLVLKEILSPYLSNYSNQEQGELFTALGFKTSQNLSTTTSGSIGSKLFGMELFYDANNSALNAPGQFNGNIAWFKWRVKGEDVQAYGFDYDANSRLIQAKYGVHTNDYCGIQASSKYDVFISEYDPRGNIVSLSRNGLISIDAGGVPVFGQIDDLTYSGYSGGSNLLTSVDDISNDNGFVQSSVYGYDSTGNLISDTGKGITDITYNYLDLPTRITLDNGHIDNYYASGVKIKSVISEDGEDDITYHYVGIVNYKDLKVQSIANEEGRYVYEQSPGNLNDEYYEYFITDHLGNTRVRFADLNNDGKITVNNNDPSDDELLSSHHYYPFGMEMEGPWELSVSSPENKYNYNGKELQGDFGLDWLAYGARNYDPAIGRFHSIDRFAEKYYPLTPYQYGANNPISNIDVNGDSLQVFFTGEEARNAFIQVMNNGLEGQFEVNISDNGIITFQATESGGDLSKMSEQGKAFYEENNKVLSGKGWATMDIDYATSDVHTGNFGTATVDMADILQFNSDKSELGGTQAGKITHEIVEQYARQIQGETRWEDAHFWATKAENRVNNSTRIDSDKKSKVGLSVQQYTREGKTVSSYVRYRGGFWNSNLRIINVTKK